MTLVSKMTARYGNMTKKATVHGARCGRDCEKVVPVFVDTILEVRSVFVANQHFKCFLVVAKFLQIKVPDFPAIHLVKKLFGRRIGPDLLEFDIAMLHKLLLKIFKIVFSVCDRDRAVSQTRFE